MSRWLPLWLGLAAWLAAVVATYPVGLSTLDEVGYLGQARMLLELEARPGPSTVAVVLPSPHGPVLKYPLFFPLALAPLVLVSPSWGFLLGIGAAAALSVVAARVMDEWRREPWWGLVFLAHPTIALLSRTMTADVPLAAAIVGAWWCMRRGRAMASAGLLAAVVLLKPVGAVLAAGLIAGEWLRGAERPGRRVFLAAVAGAAGGLVGTALLNRLSTGSIGYGYRWSHQGTTEFAARYLLSSGASHLVSLLVLPPLLIAGAIALWRRKAMGPLLAAGALAGLVSFYWFVDTAPSVIESAVLAPRLILPSVAFLLIGWCDLCSRAAARFGIARAMAVVLVLAAAGSALGVGSAHRRWQLPMREARRAADAEVERRGGPLGLTVSAAKAGLLSRHPVAWAGSAGTCVVLCNTESGSYRLGEPSSSCEIGSLRPEAEIGSYRLLLDARCF